MIETHETVLNINGFEFPAKIHYQYFQGMKGRIERGTGIPIEPDTPPQVEVLELVIADVCESDLKPFFHKIKIPPCALRKILTDDITEIMEAHDES